MLSHEVDYEIYGDDMQFVEIGLDPQESVIAEAGAMMYLTQGITFETKMGDGSEPDQGMWGNLKSMMFGGEGLFLATLTRVGRVWLQSLPFSRLADRIAPYGGGSSQGEGSAIGGISTIFER